MMRILKIFLIVLVVTGTATVAAINVALNPIVTIVSNLTLQNMEAYTNGSESGESGDSESGQSVTDDNPNKCDTVIYNEIVEGNKEITYFCIQQDVSIKCKDGWEIYEPSISGSGWTLQDMSVHENTCNNASYFD